MTFVSAALSTTADSAPLSSRRLFQERINALLSAPLPQCLQHDTTTASQRQRVTDDPTAAKKGGGTTRAASPSRPLPIHEALLEKGRLLQEHRERLRQEAIERELREVRPAPRIEVTSAPVPVAAPRPAKRLPPEGQRIEDRLLQRARDKQAQEERAAQVRAVRAAEELAAVAPFHPHISTHAQASKARYMEPAPDRAAWRALRLAELAQIRQSAEAEALAELQDVPSINPHSARLAAERKTRNGLEGAPAPDALLVGEHRRRLAQWQAAEAEREALARAGPSITRHAAGLHRSGSVGDRLHAESYESAIRRLQREVEWREAHTPFQPSVTALAAASVPRYDRADGPSATRPPPTPRDAFQPAIDPVSAAIAQRLPETAMERLCKPAAVHSLASYADPVDSTRLSTSMSATTPRHGGTPRGPLRTPSAQRYGAAATAASPSSSSVPSALPRALAASLDAYERRRHARLQALRREQTALEQRECTFSPQVNPRSAVLAETAPSSAAGTRGPAAVAQRNEAWQEQRERHLETMRQWQAERAAAAEAAAGASQVRGGGPGPSAPQDRSVYSGDGTPWGAAEYLARQRQARERRQEVQAALEHGGAGRAASSAPPPHQRGRVPGGLTPEQSPSPIRSLRPPVSASQQHSIAQLWGSSTLDTSGQAAG